MIQKHKIELAQRILFIFEDLENFERIISAYYTKIPEKFLYIDESGWKLTTQNHFKDYKILLENNISEMEKQWKNTEYQNYKLQNLKEKIIN